MMTPRQPDRSRESEGSDMGIDAWGVKYLPRWGQVVYRLGLTATVVLAVLGGGGWVIQGQTATLNRLVENQIESNQENTRTLADIAAIKRDTKDAVQALRDVVINVKDTEESQRKALWEAKQDIEGVMKLVQSNTELVAVTNKLAVTTAEAVNKQAEVHAKQVELIGGNATILRKIEECMVTIKPSPPPPPPSTNKNGGTNGNGNGKSS